MTDERKRRNAQQMFAVIRSALEQMGAQYGVDEERLAVQFTTRGADLPMDITMTSDLRRQMVVVISALPVEVNPDRRLDMAVAVAVANNTIVDGGFDYDLNSGRLFFRMNNSFIDCTHGEGLVRYLIECSCKVIDHYNERFEMLGTGVIDLQKFIELAQNL